MAYVDEQLRSTEVVVARAQLSPIGAFSQAIVIGVVALPFILLGLVSGGGVALLLAVPFVLMAAVAAVGGAIKLASTEFAVTNQRVIGKTGLVRRDTIETLLPKVESIQVSEPVLGRIFGYGTIVVRGTGGSDNPFPFISGARRFRSEVAELLAD